MIEAVLSDIYADIYLNLNKGSRIVSRFSEPNYLAVPDYDKVLEIVIRHISIAQKTIEHYSNDRRNKGWYYSFRHDMAGVIGNLYASVYLLSHLYEWENQIMAENVNELLNCAESLNSALDNLKQIVDNFEEVE